MSINNKIEKVKELMKNKNIIIAFSGGADSTLLSYLAKQVAKQVKTYTFNNGLMSSDYLKEQKEVLNYLNIENKIIKENLLKNKNFIKNTEKRCFICRNFMYGSIFEAIKDEEYDMIVDGTNISDLLEDRPGIMVNYEKSIVSPFVIAGIEKKEIMEYLYDHKIPFSNSTTCLATRIATNEKITLKKINRIKYGENLINNIINNNNTNNTNTKINKNINTNMNSNTNTNSNTYTNSKNNYVRVRESKDIAIIELGNIEPLLTKNTLKLINNEFKAVNYKKVTLNIEEQIDEIKEKEIVIYKPCKDEANKIMFENELPFIIDIAKTCVELETLGKVKCSEKMGVAMLEVDKKNITLFEKGKIVARKVMDKKDAEETLIEILPKIRRKI
ncbi:MAG: 7-cyano-7-deazaguanine synthase [Methanobrevibacter sp.]|jgi:uncharacterized protein|nr:7-cyano-7-deazaguanine synthase [Candidatus Methanoflexus mossambicus]